MVQIFTFGIQTRESIGNGVRRNTGIHHDPTKIHHIGTNQKDSQTYVNSDNHCT